MKRLVVILTDSTRRGTPCRGDHAGKHQGESAGRGAGENMGKSLYCGFHGKKQARQGKQA